MQIFGMGWITSVGAVGGFNVFLQFLLVLPRIFLQILDHFLRTAHQLNFATADQMVELTVVKFRYAKIQKPFRS